MMIHFLKMNINMLALHLKLKMRHEPSYEIRYFSGGPVVKTLCFHCTG